MKFEYKVGIIGLLFSICCMIGFHFLFQTHLKTVYVCQVGIYAVEENKDTKISQLKANGYEAYTYKNNNQYYVISMISDKLSEVQKNAEELDGIVKTYQIEKDISNEELLNKLEEGELVD